MHVFVKDRKKDKVGIAIVVERTLCNAVDDAISDLLHVSSGLQTRWQRQLPAGIVLDFRGVIELIGIRKQRCLTCSMAQHPILLKVRNVSGFPKKRIDRTYERHAKFFIRNVMHDIESAGTSVGYQVL